MSLKLNGGAGSSGSTAGFNEKNKKWQMELLMERLRVKSAQHKTFPELAKAMRMSMLEKRYALDQVEKSNLQKCLDSMQHCIKVTTRQGLVERLESLSRQLGLRFMEDTSGLFISSDMFYLEIILDSSGFVQDVKVHHECKIEQQSCSELVNCLAKGDFVDFTLQLEGLASIYQLNAETKIKSKAFVVLQALETDLSALYMLQNYLKEPYGMLLQSSVGVLQKRLGGHPMRLTYFVPSYELLSLETKSMKPLTIEYINSEKNLGLFVTVNLEASTAHKLQVQPILSVTKDQQGRNSPTYAQIGTHNSIMLPAIFVLRLNKPMPVCTKLTQQIQQITDNNFCDSMTTTPILGLLTSHVTNGEILDTKKGLFVSLPDQNHCYFMTDNKNLQGVVISSIPFTEPSHVPQIIRLLRQQALFNTLIASCIRTFSNKHDLENTTMFEIGALSYHHISIALEHPFEESMATVEFNLSDCSNVTCKIYSINTNYDGIATKLSRIIQKSMSIPITLRSLIRFWEQENIKSLQCNLDNGNFNLSLGPNDPGGRSNDFRDIKGKGDRNDNGFGGNNGNTNGRSMFHQPNLITNTTAATITTTTKTPYSEHGMFTNATDSTLMNQLQVNSAAANQDMNYMNAKITKRRRTEDFWKSPKRELTNSEPLLEHSNNSSDSNSLGTVSSVVSDAGVATPNSNTTSNSQQECESIGNDITLDNVKNYSDGGDASEFPEGADGADSTKAKSVKISKIDKSDDNTKSGTPPSVSITPITSTSGFSSVLTGLEKRLGIEIIPITSNPTPHIKSSITITPINSSSRSSGSSSGGSGISSERKPSSPNVTKKSDDLLKGDKKKKRKREDMPMGPPEKMPLKSDPLSRPVSVSIKTTDGSPLSPSGLLRKFTTSPVHGKNSPTQGSSKPSPKHSPGHHSSPKHQSLSSPKGQYGTSSPKHPASSSGSGKPSMYALKTAANSPSSKSEKSSKSSRDGSRERDKEKDRDRDRDRDRSIKYSSDRHSPKLSKSTVKLKQLDMNTSLQMSNDVFMDAALSNHDSSKLAGNSQAKNRKGSLSAVIDKLKSAQHATDEIPTQKLNSNVGNSIVAGALTMATSKDRSNLNITSTITSGSSSNSSAKNNEYMVKPSSDGMKITINKTRTKDSSPSSTSRQSGPGSGSGSGSNSPKTHTGLKPGVNSGPASRKPGLPGVFQGGISKTTSPQMNLSSSISPSGSSTKPTFQRSSSSGSLSTNKSSSKFLASSNSSDGFSKKDKNHKGTKAGNERQNVLDVMKMLGFAGNSQTMEGFMKTFDTKFQIPKLSARSATGEDMKKEPPIATSTVAPATSTITAATTIISTGASSMLHASSSLSSSASALAPHLTLPSTHLPSGSTAAQTLGQAPTSTLASAPVSALALAPTPSSSQQNSTLGSNEEATKMLMDFLSKDKYSSYGLGKFTTETNQLNNQHINSVSNLSGLRSSSSPKYTEMHYNSDLHLFKSSSSDTITNSIKDYREKHFSSLSNPTTPTYTVAPPFPSPISFTQPSTMDKSPSYTSSPSESPKINHMSMVNNQTMRPPSAPPISSAHLSTTSVSQESHKTADNVLDFSASMPPISSSTAVASSVSVAATPTASSSTTTTTTPPPPPPPGSFIKSTDQPSTTKLIEHRNPLPIPIRKNTPSPSVQLHIVKSPVPSPLVNPSPHSNSPCITDDELMDEALVGIGGK